MGRVPTLKGKKSTYLRLSLSSLVFGLGSSSGSVDAF